MCHIAGMHPVQKTPIQGKLHISSPMRPQHLSADQAKPLSQEPSTATIRADPTQHTNSHSHSLTGTVHVQAFTQLNASKACLTIRSNYAIKLNTVCMYAA